MKKRNFMISVIVLAVCLVFQASAATVVTHNGYFQDEEGYAYTFARYGLLDDEADPTEMGFEVKGIRYPVKTEEQFQKALASKAFGIGLLDDYDLLGLKYTATPYIIVNGEVIYGDPFEVDKTPYDPQKDARLTSITIGGKTLPKFDPDIYTYYTSPAELGITLLNGIEGTATVKAEGAAYTCENVYFYNANVTTQRSSTFVFEVTAPDGQTKAVYTVNCNCPELLPVIQDTDIRNKPASIFQGTNQNIYVTKDDIKSLLKFDISQLSHVKSAKFMLYKAGKQEVDLTFYKVQNDANADWDEMTLIAANAPAIGTEIVSTGTITGQQSLSIDITKYLQECITNKQTYMSIAVGGTETTTFSSKEYSAPGYRPYILIEYEDAP